jgi:nitrogen regulatory protein P-II 2
VRELPPSQRACGLAQELLDHGASVKKVETIVDNSRLDRVRAVVDRVGADTMTVIEVRGYQRDSTHVESYRGSQHMVFLVSRAKVEIVVEDGRAPALVEELNRELRSWGRGEGIVIYAVEELRPPPLPSPARRTQAPARRAAPVAPPSLIAQRPRDGIAGAGHGTLPRVLALVLAPALALFVHLLAPQVPQRALKAIAAPIPRMTHRFEPDCKNGRWSHGVFSCFDPAPPRRAQQG